MSVCAVVEKIKDLSFFLSIWKKTGTTWVPSIEQFEFGTWELVKGRFYCPVGFSGEIGTCDHQAVPVILGK